MTSKIVEERINQITKIVGMAIKGETVLRDVARYTIRLEIKARKDMIDKIRNAKYKSWDWKELAYRLDDEDAELEKELNELS